jgi:hypothetical protein
VAWTRRQKRLTEMPLPEALRASFSRCQKLDRPDVLVWAESTTLTIDRLLHQYRETLNVDTVWDAHHHALQLIGMTQSLVERAEKIEFERPPT